MALSTRVRDGGRPIMLLPWFGLDQAVMAEAFEPAFSMTAAQRRMPNQVAGMLMVCAGVKIRPGE